MGIGFAGTGQMITTIAYGNLVGATGTPLDTQPRYLDPPTPGASNDAPSAFLDGYRPTNVDTQTYIFLDDVLAQGAAPAGFPMTWNGVAPDYAMEPDSADLARIAGDPAMTPTQYNAAITASLRSLTPKHSFRLLFKDLYGAGRLDYPLFPDAPAGSFNTTALRANTRDTWASTGGYAGANASYIRDHPRGLANPAGGFPPAMGATRRENGNDGPITAAKPRGYGDREDVASRLWSNSHWWERI